MFNINQFQAPIHQPPMSFSTMQPPQNNSELLQQAFNPPQTNFSDPNGAQSFPQQNFQPASSQFNMPAPQLQTFESYPQVQTQINLNLPGMPPLTVNTPRIDPTKYSVP
jgi:hypothetical protein